MNTGAEVHVEEEARQEGASNIIDHRPDRDAGFLEAWLLTRVNALALAVVAAGFGIRIFAATRNYLNPDEALHYLLVNQNSIWLAYKASLTNAHPPLIYLVLYYWHFLGRSELMLRLPSVIAGTAFCWMFYKWTAMAFGRVASCIGLIFVTFSPAMIALSAEVRAYALLLFCVGGALYFLERAFAENSVGKMWCFSVFLYLAILSHYSAAFFALAAGVYTLARIADSHLPRRVIIAWAGGQAGALTIYAFLYVTHLSKIKNSLAIWSMSFGTAYFHRDTISLFTFTRESTFGVFLFLSGQRNIAQIMMLCFVAGVAVFFAKGLLSGRASPQSNRLGILLLFPFIGVWLASIAGVYPYVGSRHTAFLAPFAIAAASYTLAAASGQRLWAGVIVATFLMVAPNTSHGSVPTEKMTENQSRTLMATAVGYMEQSVPHGDRILVDYQSSLPLTYYLCGPQVVFPIETFQGDYFEFNCNGHLVVSLPTWKVIPQGFPLQFEKMARSHHLNSGDRVWVYQTGWGVDLGTEMAANDAAFRCLAPKRFGGGVTITLFLVGADFSPVSPLRVC